mgnify:FL=1
MTLKLAVPIQRAFAVLTWERAIPAFLPTLIGLAFVFALLWTGSYALLPPVWHIAALLVSVVALACLTFWGTARFRYPRLGETLRRIEERNHLKAGVLDSAFARPFASSDDDPLWLAARDRLRQVVGRPKAPLPRVDWRAADPWALRYAAMLAVLLAIVSTRGSQDGLRASLVPPVENSDPVLVDAWIEPPEYTGLPSSIIKDARPGRLHVVPEDSMLHVRLRRDDGAALRGVLTFKPENGRRRRIVSNDSEGTAALIPLAENGALSVTTRGRTREYRFRTMADRPPQVTVLGDPDTSTGAIRIEVGVVDDYPLAAGRMVLSLIPGQKTSRDAPMPDQRIVDTPDDIDLPDLTGPSGIRTIEAETAEHPWSGLMVKAQIEVTDGRGQTAMSEPFAFTMPARTFYNPLSQAVIAERQKLAMAPSYLNTSAKLFGALTHAPDLFDIQPSEHLMLKAMAQAVAAAKQRDVPDLVDGLWPLAIELEDDGLAFAKARLDAAEQALRDALRNGAGQEELRRRIAELREAMNSYIRALAESGLGRADPSEDQQTFAETDLENLLRQMEELASQGARDEAESLLRQLEALLQSLQFASGAPGAEGQQGQQGSGQGQPGTAGGSGGPGGQGEGEAALSGAGDLIQKQRELSDQTFSARRGDRGTDGLGSAQKDLADELSELMGELPSGSGSSGEAFAQAEDAMRSAAEALERGDLGRAQALQERALSAMREGGQELAATLDRQGGDGEKGSIRGTDPFGRAWRGEDGPRPEDFGLYDPERIRALISDIRERLRDPDLGEAERAYLESLLDRF